MPGECRLVLVLLVPPLLPPQLLLVDAGGAAGAADRGPTFSCRFTYDKEALCWTKRVATEAWSMYGHHRSLYGWYIAGESSGVPSSPPTTFAEMDVFFSEFRRFARQDLTPIARRGDSGTSVPALLPIMFAINTAGAMSVTDSPSGGWSGVLRHLDVLAAFGFARLANSATAAQLTQLSQQNNASFWIDMELFRADMSQGLLPKDFKGMSQSLALHVP